MATDPESLKELKRLLTICVEHSDNELKGEEDCGCGDGKGCSVALARDANLEAIADIDKELNDIITDQTRE